MEKTYKCSKCNERKNIEQFYQTLNAKQSYCIECFKKIKKERHRIKDEWTAILCGEGNWMQCYGLI